MKVELTWRGVALFFIATSLFFGSLLLFLNSKENPSNLLTDYLKTENALLKKEQDSLFNLIKTQGRQIADKDKILLDLTKIKNQVKVVYYEKYQKIDDYTIRQLTDEFDSIFAKSGIR